MAVEADAPRSLTQEARAKVNLWLHVVGRRDDGYHLLDSLVAFPSVGDVLEVEPSPFLSLTVDGPFGQELGAGLDNIVLRAADGLGELIASGPERAPGAALRLDKRLPVASGVGGGSSDAAAALRLLMRLWRRPVEVAALHDLALSLGADVPTCLFAPEPVFLRGIGDDVSRAPALPRCALLLVNPGTPLSTPRVFQALASRENPPPPPFQTPKDLGALVGALSAARNDLEPAALQVAPTIGTVLDALRSIPNCRFARMSGSGATCFGVFTTEAEAWDAAALIKTEEPGWWTGVGMVGEPL